MDGPINVPSVASLLCTSLDRKVPYPDISTHHYKPRFQASCLLIYDVVYRTLLTRCSLARGRIIKCLVGNRAVPSGTADGRHQQAVIKPPHPHTPTLTPPARPLHTRRQYHIIFAYQRYNLIRGGGMTCEDRHLSSKGLHLQPSFKMLSTSRKNLATLKNDI